MQRKIGVVISNHEAEPETERAMNEQFKLDEVKYFKHPDIDPRMNKKEVWEQATEFMWNIGHELRMHEIVVAIINGEYGFSTACVHGFTNINVPCYYPTTERGATEELLPDKSIKTTHVYKFVQFREW